MYMKSISKSDSAITTRICNISCIICVTITKYIDDKFLVLFIPSII